MPDNADTASRLFIASQSASASKQKDTRNKIDICLGKLRDRYRNAMRLKNSDVPAEQNSGIYNAADSANSLAWLLANTNGDCNEALKFAKSVSGTHVQRADYLDTLALCQFKLGSIAEAVKTQRIVVFRNPSNPKYMKRLQQYEKELTSKR